jgi:hypothetical protein
VNHSSRPSNRKYGGPLARLLAATGLAVAIAPAAHAATFVLDGNTGADYDAIGDGWFFTTPPNLPPDGVGDLGGNLLAVGIQNGVVELRTLSEFPLSSLGALTSAEVQSATLTFRIDDVVATFGPGTTFDGTASDPIAIYAYPADGTVNVADFSPAGLAAVEIVNVGVITDASLAISGPLDFDVDVTDALKDALDNSDVALGILFGTLDNPTATSLDGVLPFVTVETQPAPTPTPTPTATPTPTPIPEPPVFSNAEIKCQTAIAKQAGLYAKKSQQQVGKCFDQVLKAVSGGDPASAAQSKCAKAIDLSNAGSVLGKARATAASKIVSSCNGLTPADVNSPCDAGATDFTATATCVLDDHELQVEDLVKAEYRDACALISSVGLLSSFPGFCAP